MGSVKDLPGICNYQRPGSPNARDGGDALDPGLLRLGAGVRVGISLFVLGDLRGLMLSRSRPIVGDTRSHWRRRGTHVDEADVVIRSHQWRRPSYLIYLINLIVGLGGVPMSVIRSFRLRKGKGRRKSSLLRSMTEEFS